MLKDVTRFWRSALPNILVYIDIRDGLPTAPSLFAVSEARRIARLAGASIFAVVASPPLGTETLEILAAPIAEAGADKLLLCEADDFDDPAHDDAHGRALDAAAARVSPMLILFPPGGSGTALGAPLAARLGGSFAPWCDFATSDADIPSPEGSGRIQAIHFRPDGRSLRRLDPLDIERPIVVTLGAGRRPAATGKVRDLEVEVISSVKTSRQRTRAVESGRVPNTFAAFELASILILIGEIGEISESSAIENLAPADILAAGVPPGTVVARARDVPSSVLAACCPDVLLKIGPSTAVTARSARTRVVLATVSRHADPAPEDVDVIWQVASAADLTVGAIATLLAEMADPS